MPRPHLLSSTESAAYGAKLSQVDVVSHYYTPFAHNISDTLRKIHQCHFLDNPSFSAALNAAIGSELAGRRSFVASSKLNPEDVATAAYMRLPIVIANVSRPVGAFSIRQDHSDVMLIRDTGCIIFMPESSLDVIESVVQAYKVCEDPKVLLPAVVNIDLPHFSESLLLPNEAFAKRFVGKLKLPFGFHEKKHAYFAVPDENYAEFRKQQQRALENSLEIVEKVSLAWKNKFKKTLAAVETYKTEDADLVLIISGFHSTTAKAAVNKMRAEGKKVGRIRLRIIRPFQAEAIKNAVKNAKRVAVFDQAISLGSSGVLYQEIKPLAGFCSDFIALGKHPSEKNFIDIFTRLEKSQKEEVVWL